MKEKVKTIKGHNSKGITLVALVVTIIVLLILAGVTIMTLFGENGLINMAQKAKEETEKSVENVEKGLNNLFSEMLEELGEDAKRDDWYGVTDTIDITGKTEYHIKSCKELKMLANTVNAGKNFEGITVYLDENLDLQGNETKQWTPIGAVWNKPFNGIFDGQNHYVSGMYININDTEDATGLFGTIDGNACIQNLGVAKGYVSALNDAGGVVGSMYEDTIVKNCYNLADINGGEAGGIVGNACGTVGNCNNGGKIRGDGDGAGGIAGNANYCTIKACYNIGEISGDCMYTGGIVGFNEEGNLAIENCYNLGKVSGSNNYVAGISGHLGSNSSINNCYNLGIIEGTTKGEIAARTYGDEDVSTNISNCYFLSTSVNQAIGESEGVVTVTAVTGKTEQEMKTLDFVNLLNNGETAWMQDKNKINKGLPILSWQK